MAINQFKSLRHPSASASVDLRYMSPAKRVMVVDVCSGVVTRAVVTPFEARGVPPHAAVFVTLDPM